MTELLYSQYYIDVLLGMLLVVGITFGISAAIYGIVRMLK